MDESSVAARCAVVRSTFAGEDDFAELLRGFAELIPQKRQSLLAMKEAGEFEPLQAFAHQLKGAGGGYGFPGLSEAAAELEQICKNRNADDLSQAVDRLVDYLDRIEV